MNDYSAAVTTALVSSTPVYNIVGAKIFLEQPPTMADFPCVTFSQSVTPAGGADNLVYADNVIFNVECWVRNGSAWPLAKAVEAVFVQLGYVCRSAQDVPPLGGIFQVSLQFQNVKEV